MRKNLITALLIAGGILVWLVSGELGDSPDGMPGNTSLADRQLTDQREESALPAVRVREITASSRLRTLELRGRTEAKRIVEVRAEISGRVEERVVERGDRVEQGQPLCRIAVDDRQAAVEEAEAEVEQTRLEYEGSQRLKEKGLQSDTAIARTRAALAAAKADAERARLNLARTVVAAPFDGVVEDIYVNSGDFVSPGDACARLIDLDPMLVTASATETDVVQISPGDPVSGFTTTGAEIDGRVTFVSRQSDPVTRTYPVEVTVPNADGALPSGITATVRVALDTVRAQLVPPTLLTLDDEGNVGVKTLTAANTVEMYEVDIIEDSSDGVWVTGLPETTRLITVGQEFVGVGQKVSPRPQDVGGQLAQP
jgi:multidrug efflux system membrane fusion protein